MWFWFMQQMKKESNGKISTPKTTSNNFKKQSNKMEDDEQWKEK
jgi:hypothetical protein